MSITETVNIGSVTPATWEASNPANIYVGEGSKWVGNTPLDVREYVTHLFDENGLYLALLVAPRRRLGYRKTDVNENGGDLYVMSEKASGYDWKKTVGSRWNKTKLAWDPPLPWDQHGKFLATLRHAAGHDSYLN